MAARLKNKTVALPLTVLKKLSASPRESHWPRRCGNSAASFESQAFRASGLNLIVSAIVHWNTVYLDRAVTV